MYVSIVVPVYNEEKNVRILHHNILKVLRSMRKSHEIIFVDDGSTDDTYGVLSRLSDVTIVKFRKNFGQTAALAAGFDIAKGRYVVSLDGDLQNDPLDIPRLLEHLKKYSYDVVCGWRYPRKDPLSKKVLSLFSNSLRSLLIRDPVHDSGCTLRAYRRECFDDIDLMGEMHRYIPAILRWKGFRIGELKVRHFKRRYGRSKYNYKRLFKGLMDLVNVWFWRKFSTRPLHIFGGLGLLSGAAGISFGIAAIAGKIFSGIDLSDNFLAIASVFLTILGAQFFVSGLLADIAVKNYYRAGRSRIYNIEKILRKK